MTEFKVWRSIVDWVEDHGGSVIAACPPGSSVYSYKKFCLIDPVTGKRDEPDILLLWRNVLYFIECKPSLRGVCAKGRKAGSDESDIDKLLRIEAAYHEHHYDKQLLENYGVNVNCFQMRIGVGYASQRESHDVMNGITQFVVLDGYHIKIVG